MICVTLVDLASSSGPDQFGKARCRLYRSRFLRGNMRFAAFVKIYNICARLHRSEFKILVWKIDEQSVIILWWNFITIFANCEKKTANIWQNKLFIVSATTRLPITSCAEFMFGESASAILWMAREKNPGYCSKVQSWRISGPAASLVAHTPSAKCKVLKFSRCARLFLEKLLRSH